MTVSRSCFALTLAALPLALAAPEARGQAGLVDQVVAIVGDSVVLLSEVIQSENRIQAEGGTLPPAGTPQRDSVRQRVLEELVNTQLILQAALQDTLLRVDEEMVEEGVTEAMEQLERGFRSRGEMERALAAEGLSLQAFRELRREQITQQQLVGLYLQRNSAGSAVEVTEEEMLAAYEAGRAGLQRRPATVTFKQVMMPVAPTDSAKAKARSQIEGILERARAGEDFAELAGSYSQDPVSAAAGGSLGWFRRGEMTEAFENAAFSLLEGTISNVVETEYGFHIIKVDRVRFSERQASHILIRPTVDYRDLTRSRELAEEIAARAATEDFQELIDEYHSGAIPDSATIPVRQVAQMLPAAYVAALGGREAGEVVGPVQFNYAAGENFAVIKILEAREEGEYTFEDLRAQIRASLTRDKRIEELIQRLRAGAYIEIKNEL